MRIEPIQWLGSFWEPANPDSRVSGQLVVSTTGRVSLELFEPLGLNNDLGTRRVQLIHGVTREGKALTVVDSYVATPFAVSVFRTGSVKVRAQRLLVGACLNEAEIAGLNQINFSVEGLDEWAGINAVHTEYETRDDRHIARAVITLTPPVDRPHQLKSGQELTVRFIPSISHTSRSAVEAKVAASIQLRTAGPCSLNQLLTIAHRLNTFLCVAIGQTVAIKWVSVRDDRPSNESPDGRPRSLQVYFPSRPNSTEVPNPSRHTMPFLLQDIESLLGIAVARWLEDYEQLQPTFDLFFAATTTADGFLETQFLLIAQCLETFHRRTSDERVMTKSDFDTVLSKLLAACPADKREWLNDRLAFANELSLRRRLRELFLRIAHFVEGLVDMKSLIQQTVATRNQLTHHPEDKLPGAATGVGLLRLSLQLEAVTTLLFLQRIEMSDATIKQILKAGTPIAQKLNGTFFDAS